jgi:hypothetical protein
LGRRADLINSIRATALRIVRGPPLFNRLLLEQMVHSDS